MHVGVADELTEVPHPCDGLCGVTIDEHVLEEPRSRFGPGSAGKPKPTVIEGRPGTQSRAAADSMAVKANRFEEGAVAGLQ